MAWVWSGDHVILYGCGQVILYIATYIIAAGYLNAQLKYDVT